MKTQRLTIEKISVDLYYDKDKDEIRIFENSLVFKYPKIETLTNNYCGNGLEKIINSSDIDYGILSLGAKVVDSYPKLLENNSLFSTRKCYVTYQEVKYPAGISNKPKGRITGLTDFYKHFNGKFKEGYLIKYNLRLDNDTNIYTNQKEEITIIEITDIYKK